MNVFIMSTYRVLSATAGQKKRTHNGAIILLADLFSGLCTSQLELRILVFVQRLRLLQERPVNLAGTILPLTTLTFTRPSLPTLRHICSQKISHCDFINLMCQNLTCVECIFHSQFNIDQLGQEYNQGKGSRRCICTFIWAQSLSGLRQFVYAGYRNSYIDYIMCQSLPPIIPATEDSYIKHLQRDRHFVFGGGKVLFIFTIWAYHFVGARPRHLSLA